MTMRKAAPALQLFAYYLSKYDMDAVKALGFKNRSNAMIEISKAFYVENNYLKLRRDEFDVVTQDRRKGWRNRQPTESIKRTAEYYDTFSFEELTQMALSLSSEPSTQQDKLLSQMQDEKLTENEFEHIINYQDEKACQRIENAEIKIRVLDRRIISSLKLLYHYRCQICGISTMETYGVPIIEAHHIQPFSESLNNDASNIAILCPNHHRLVHNGKAVFDRDKSEWIYANGYIEKLTINLHL